ncbi:hypothetical protein, partial [Nocardia gipuzkoensis]|uniref:hypothetical protein n=1 Tax=Nocardia gipuzkoensis TaxID=2749991 RepID=UPI002458617D
QQERRGGVGGRGERQRRAAAAAQPGEVRGPGPPPPGGAGQGNTAHKPAKFLQSKTHLDDAIGAVPDRVKPVIES